MAATPPLERFWRRVRQEGECLIWTGSTSGYSRRYPAFRPGTRATDPNTFAHRWIYEQLVGPIPEGLELDHTCRRPLCVNVDHLEPVTHAENLRRARLEVCRSGRHDLTNPDNCRWDENGYRRGCILCHREKARERGKRRYREKKGT